jgi:hypothetical protein
VLQLELVLDDEVRDVVGHLTHEAPDLVVGAAVELDLDPVGAVEHRVVAPRGSLDELDLEYRHDHKW